MPTVQDTKAIIDYVSLRTGEPSRLVRAVFDIDIRGGSRGWVLRRYADVFRQIARAEPPRRQLFTDPISRYWRIRGLIREVSLSRPGVELAEFRAGGLAHKAMAVRLFAGRNDHTGVNPVRDQIHNEISGERSGPAPAWRKSEAAAWRTCYEIARAAALRPRAHRDPTSYDYQMEWEDMACRYCNADCLGGGHFAGFGAFQCAWNPYTGEVRCCRPSRLPHDYSPGRSLCGLAKISREVVAGQT